MQYASAAAGLGLLFLLVIAGLVGVVSALPTATFPSELSGFGTYGGLLVAVVIIGGLGAAVLSFGADRSS